MTECGPMTEDFPKMVLRASVESILTEGDWKDWWKSRVPEAMFSVRQRKFISIRENTVKWR